MTEILPGWRIIFSKLRRIYQWAKRPERSRSDVLADNRQLMTLTEVIHEVALQFTGLEFVRGSDRCRPDRVFRFENPIAAGKGRVEAWIR